MDRSMCLPGVSLDPPESTSQMAYRSVQPFLHSSGQPYTLQWAAPFPLKIVPTHRDLDPHLIVFLGQLKSTTQTASRSVQWFLQGSRSWQTDCILTAAAASVLQAYC